MNEIPLIPGALRWLLVDMNSFFASCEQQENPALRGQPVVVVPMVVDSTCAIAASYEAKAFGIKTGTPVWEAKQKCPALRIVHARPKLYVEYHQRIIEAVESCIPVEEVMSIDEVACRLDRLQQEPSAAIALALQIKTAIHLQAGPCLTSSIGIAANRLLAKIASDMQKPDGLVVLQASSLPQAILHLKLRDICGIGRNMEARLLQAGIPNIASLWAADGQRLRRVWGGVAGLRFHTLLHGADLASPKHPRRSISHQHVLPPEQRRLDKATPIIRQLLIRAALRLRNDGFYCRRLSLDIKWQQRNGYFFEERHFNETQDTDALLKILGPMWNAAPALSPLRIGVTLTGLVPCAAHQPDLFDRPKPASLTAALDRLNAKFGRGTVGYGTTLPAMVSKIAFHRVPHLSEF